jgi:hypothetical protein
MEFEGFCSWFPATVTWSLCLFLSLTPAVPQCKPSGRHDRGSLTMRMRPFTLLHAVQHRACLR